MLYAIITILFVALVAVAVKWAKAAREIRMLKMELQVVRAGSISHDSALYAGDRRFADGRKQGFYDGLIAAEKAATRAVVEGKPPVMAVRDLRNATK